MFVILHAWTIHFVKPQWSSAPFIIEGSLVRVSIIRAIYGGGFLVWHTLFNIAFSLSEVDSIRQCLESDWSMFSSHFLIENKQISILNYPSSSMEDIILTNNAYLCLKHCHSYNFFYLEDINCLFGVHSYIPGSQ